jgi:hypothetical protein
VRTRLAIIVLLISLPFLATSLEAACMGTSVVAFGAKGDGQSDDSAAIQNAINAAAAADPPDSMSRDVAPAGPAGDA